MKSEKGYPSVGVRLRAVLVLFRSGIPAEESLPLVEKWKDNDRKVPGLLQKFYVRDVSTGQLGGFMVFDSEESLTAFRKSGHAEKAFEAFKIQGAPEVRPLDVGATLYPLK